VELPREQAGNTGPVERHLPTGEFLLREEIALTRDFASDDPGRDETSTAWSPAAAKRDPPRLSM